MKIKGHIHRITQPQAFAASYLANSGKPKTGFGNWGKARVHAVLEQCLSSAQVAIRTAHSASVASLGGGTLMRPLSIIVLALGTSSVLAQHASDRKHGLIEGATNLPSVPIVRAVSAGGTPTEQVGLRAPERKLFIDVLEDGTVWARGATYKASFANGAATYIPFLGSRAPRNYPLEMRLESVSSGGRDLELDFAASAQVAGERIVFERGAVREEYVLTDSSIEQIFVVPNAPRDAELLVRLRLTSELDGHTDAAGLRFANELGAVLYGSATAFDSAGRARALSTVLVSGAIEITIPEDFLAESIGPIVIDPVISTFAVDTTSANRNDCDVAWDETTNDYLVVFEEEFSGTDSDVYAVQVNESGGLVAQGYIDVSSSEWDLPQVANNNIANQFLVVANTGPTGLQEIRGRLWSATSGFALGFITVAGSEQTGLKLECDVGGDPATAGPTYYCVVWQRQLGAGDNDVHARLVTSTGTLVGAGPISIAVGSATNDVLPSVSKSDGMPPFATQNWHVVWNRYSGAGDANVMGARILWDGTITSSAFSIATSAADEWRPVASPPLDDVGGSRPWLVAWYREEAASDLDLIARAYAGTSFLDEANLSQLSGVDALDAQYEQSVDTDGRQFVVAHTRYTNPGGAIHDFDTFVSTVHVAGGQIGFTEVVLPLGFQNGHESGPSVAAARSSATPHRACIGFSSSAGTQFDVYAALYDLPAGGPIAGMCFGDGSGTACPCGNSSPVGSGAGCSNSFGTGALLAGSGVASVEDDTLVLQASGMPPTGHAPTFFQGTVATNAGQGTQFGDGLRCASGTVVRLGTVPSSGGVAAYGLGVPGTQLVSVRGAIPLSGATRYYQVNYRNSVSFCTGATFNLTNGVSITWVP